MTLNCQLSRSCASRRSWSQEHLGVLRGSVLGLFNGGGAGAVGDLSPTPFEVAVWRLKNSLERTLRAQ